MKGFFVFRNCHFELSPWAESKGKSRSEGDLILAFFASHAKGINFFLRIKKKQKAFDFVIGSSLTCWLNCVLHNCPLSRKKFVSFV